MIPRADAHQGEYVAPHDERLLWLTGFTGSAGFCIVLPQIAGVFIDGRYRVQVKSQVDLAHFTPVPWPETKPGDWLAEHLPEGGVIGFDPWLHTADEIAKLEGTLAATGITLMPSDNAVDAIWPDQPAPPVGRVLPHPLEFAGQSSADKRAQIAEALRQAGQAAAVLTLPDSISWLLNIRGSDIARNPVVQALAILQDDARLTLFIDPAKLDDAARAHLSDGVHLQPPAGFVPALGTLTGPVRVDRATAPLAVSQLLDQAGIALAWGQDPCLLPKARKNPAEIEGSRQAHLRDGAAMVEFLAWLDANAPGDLTEIGVVQKLEGFRRATNACARSASRRSAAPARMARSIHYRVTEETDRALRNGRASAGRFRRPVPRWHHRHHPHRGHRPRARGRPRRLHPRASGHDRHFARALAARPCGARP